MGELGACGDALLPIPLINVVPISLHRLSDGSTERH